MFAGVFDPPITQSDHAQTTHRDRRIMGCDPAVRHAMCEGYRAGAVERTVTFGEAPGDAHEAIDSAYHSKYDRYGRSIVGRVVGTDAHAVTARLVPTADEE